MTDEQKPHHAGREGMSETPRPTHQCPYCDHQWTPIERKTCNPPMYQCPVCHRNMVCDGDYPTFGRQKQAIRLNPQAAREGEGEKA